MNLTRPNLPESGYQVFPQVVPTELCTSVADAIENHTEGGKYGGITPDGLVEFYHHPSMWNVRQLPSAHQVFSKVLGTERLWISVDRVCRKIPIGDSDTWLGFMHWDVNPNVVPRTVEVQGLVALTDTEEDSGGFWCCPTLYQNLDGWKEGQPTRKILQTSLHLSGDGNSVLFYRKIGGPVKWFPEELGPVVRVPMKAGDLLIWDSYLPHGNGPNRSEKIRYCQYLTMFPVGDDRLRRERISCWETNSPPSGLAFFGDPRMVEQKKPPAKLTELGMKLLGLSSWTDAYSTFHDEWGLM